MPKKKASKVYGDKSIKDVPPKKKRANTKTPEADKALKQRRLAIITRNIIEGYSQPELIASMMTDWKLSERQCYRYLTEANEAIRVKNEATLEQNIEIHRQRLENLYHQLIVQKDYKGAAVITKQLADLHGLDAPKRVDLGAGGKPIATAIEDVGAGINALIRLQQLRELAPQKAKASNGTATSE